MEAEAVARGQAQLNYHVLHRGLAVGVGAAGFVHVHQEVAIGLFQYLVVEGVARHFPGAQQLAQPVYLIQLAEL